MKRRLTQTQNKNLIGIEIYLLNVLVTKTKPKMDPKPKPFRGVGGLGGSPKFFLGCPKFTPKALGLFQKNPKKSGSTPKTLKVNRGFLQIYPKNWG